MRNENKTSISSEDIFSQAGFLRPWPLRAHHQHCEFQTFIILRHVGWVEQFYCRHVLPCMQTTRRRRKSSLLFSFKFLHQGVVVLANSHAGAFSTFLQMPGGAELFASFNENKIHISGPQTLIPLLAILIKKIKTRKNVQNCVHCSDMFHRSRNHWTLKIL